MKMLRTNLVVMLFCLVLQSYKISCNMVLQQSSVVFRHGDRTASDFTFRTDPYTESDWPQGYSQLTLTGMQQEYELGQLLKNRYVTENNLIFDNYTRVQTYVRSSDYDRTLMSAEALLASLFFPGNSQRFNDSIAWQPVPVHTTTRADDFLLRPTNSCPRFRELINSNQNYAFYTDREAMYQPFMDRVGEITGVIPCNFTNIWRIEDTIYVQYVTPGYTPPSWANESVINTLIEIADFTASALFTGEKAQLKQRLSAGPLLNKILTDMRSKVNAGSSSIDDKLFLYSGHDSTITSIASSLQVHNGRRRGYASALAIELYSDDQNNNDNIVRLFLRNGPDNDTFAELCMPCSSNCASPCTLQQFSDLISPLIPADIMAECAATSTATTSANSSGKSEANLALWAFVGLLLAVVVMLI